MLLRDTYYNGLIRKECIVIKKRIKDTLKSKKGINTIETAILSFIIIMCIGGMTDLNTIMKKFNATSSTTSYISRTVSKQGGVRTNAPESFSGDYITSSELYNDVKSVLNKAGISSSDFKVTINNQVLNNTTNIPIVNYGKNIDINLQINYKWKFTENFGASPTYTKNSPRIAVSTFKNRTDSTDTTTVE